MPGYKDNYDVATEEELHRAISIHRIILIVTNLLSLAIGLATFSVCIWVRFDLDFWEWVVEINWYSYWYAMYPIMFAMICVVILSLMGLYGSVYVRLGWLSCIMWSLVVMFFFHLIGAVT